MNATVVEAFDLTPSRVPASSSLPVVHVFSTDYKSNPIPASTYDNSLDNLHTQHAQRLEQHKQVSAQRLANAKPFKLHTAKRAQKQQSQQQQSQPQPDQKDEQHGSIKVERLLKPSEAVTKFKTKLQPSQATIDASSAPAPASAFASSNTAAPLRSIVERQSSHDDDPSTTTSTRTPSLAFVPRPVKLTTAVILREESAQRKSDAMMAAQILAYSQQLRDVSEFKQWQLEQEELQDRQDQEIVDQRKRDEKQSKVNKAKQAKLARQQNYELAQQQQMDEMNRTAAYRRQQQEELDANQAIVRAVSDQKGQIAVAMSEVEQHKLRLAAQTKNELQLIRQEAERQRHRDLVEARKVIRAIQAMEMMSHARAKRGNRPPDFDATVPTGNIGLLERMTLSELREKHRVMIEQEAIEQQHKRDLIRQRQADKAETLEKMAMQHELRHTRHRQIGEERRATNRMQRASQAEQVAEESAATQKIISHRMLVKQTAKDAKAIALAKENKIKQMQTQINQNMMAAKASTHTPTTTASTSLSTAVTHSSLGRNRNANSIAPFNQLQTSTRRDRHHNPVAVDQLQLQLHLSPKIMDFESESKSNANHKDEGESSYKYQESNNVSVGIDRELRSMSLTQSAKAAARLLEAQRQSKSNQLQSALQIIQQRKQADRQRRNSIEQQEIKQRDNRAATMQRITQQSINDNIIAQSSQDSD